MTEPAPLSPEDPPLSRTPLVASVSCDWCSARSPRPMGRHGVPAGWLRWAARLSDYGRRLIPPLLCPDCVDEIRAVGE